MQILQERLQTQAEDVQIADTMIRRVVYAEVLLMPMDSGFKDIRPLRAVYVLIGRFKHLKGVPRGTPFYYNIKQIRPEQPSLITRSRVSCNFRRASTGIL